MMKTKYGIQMYSIRDITEDSMREALSEVANMGYKYVEFAGFFDYSAEEIKMWLDEFGLLCSGTHTTLDSLTPDVIDKTIDYHKKIGCDTIIVPCCSWSIKEKFEASIEGLVFAQKRLSENGMNFGYHNHSAEFLPTDDGIVFEDELIRRTDCQLQIDIFWLYNAGIDVIKYLEDHKDRIISVHLKDGISTDAKNRNINNVNDGVKGFSIGLGTAPIKEVRKWCLENNVMMVVESEDLNPTGLEEIKRCIDYLNTLEATE